MLIIALSISALMVFLFFSIINVGNIFVSNMATIKIDILQLILMSLMQASLSTILSLGAGIAIAWSLNRLDFFGKNLVVSLFATAIVAPSMVVAFGLISVWGRAGWIAQLFEFFNWEWQFSIFGLGGILFAHTILNGAFAAHILLARIDAIPARKLKTAQSLALTPFKRFILLDWAAISGALPALGSIIFLLAFTSFPIVLMLGGGVANQTLEVAIYSAVRLSFDLDLAVRLSIIQLVLCMVIILPAIISNSYLANAGVNYHYKWRQKGLAQFAQISILFVAILAFALPLLAILVDGIAGGILDTLSRPSFWQASLTSIIIGSLSAVLTLFLAVLIATGRAAFSNGILKAILGLPIFAYLVIPAVVLSLGFYLFVKNIGISPTKAAPFVLIIANSLLALPFSIAILAPAIETINQRYNKLTRSLNLSSLMRWRMVEYPLIGREIGIVLALAFCFSLGDLGIISLFGTSEFNTLPYAMYQSLGTYRNNDAAVIAAFMLILCLVVFWFLPMIFRKLSNARN